MATENAHWFIMGKTMSPPFLCCFFIISFKLAGKEDRHKISDELKFRPDRTTPYRVRCPWASEKYPIDLFWENGVSKLARSFFIGSSSNFQERHKMSDELDFRPDWISHLGVTCPWGRFKFSIDLLWNLKVQLTFQMKAGATPLTVFQRLFWNFSDVFRSVPDHCLSFYFGYNPLIIFFSLFLLCELSLFFSMKCYQDV